MKAALLTFIFFLLASKSFATESICYGTTSNGRLENGVKLPDEGINFESYGIIPGLFGRTYVHSKVVDIILRAYKMLEGEQPDKVFKYAESGFKDGGKFKPHKTHQNGLSVDFIVPVLDKNGKSVQLPTNVFNKYGYNIEFDTKGAYEGYTIDYDAMGAHIVALHKAAKEKQVDIWRVLFDPKLQPYLYKTKYGNYIKSNIKIPNKKSWVRHDEHYHVDFEVECKN